ncbi:MAG: hypothetical protein ACM3SO_07295 [Betaproteobacteria bacterium]
MNHKLWNSVGARVIAVTFVLAGLTACGERLSDTHTSKAPSNAADPSAVVIGTAPAQPTGDPPGTTPVTSQGTANTAQSNNSTEISKKEESTQKPQEGDANAFSSVAKDNPQKANGVDPQQLSDRKKD